MGPWENLCVAFEGSTDGLRAASVPSHPHEQHKCLRATSPVLTVRLSTVIPPVCNVCPTVG